MNYLAQYSKPHFFNYGGIQYFHFSKESLHKGMIEVTNVKKLKTIVKDRNSGWKKTACNRKIYSPGVKEAASTLKEPVFNGKIYNTGRKMSITKAKMTITDAKKPFTEAKKPNSCVKESNSGAKKSANSRKESCKGLKKTGRNRPITSTCIQNYL